MLVLSDVSKKFGKKTALTDINITFGQGIYGLLGPNGAGKSTMMNIIADVLEVSAGEVLLDGTNIKKLGAQYRQKIAYLPQKVGYYPDFTAERTLVYFAGLRGVRKKEMDDRVQYALEAVNLVSDAKNKVKTFSGGMKQRLGIAITLVSDPEIMILDEPTVGLDPKERVKFRNSILELGKKKTIILSTHIVSDVESVADHIILIKEGRIIGNGSKEEIISMIGNQVSAQTTIEDVYMNFFDEKEEDLKI